jgi:hypothetical protein
MGEAGKSACTPVNSKERNQLMKHMQLIAMAGALGGLVGCASAPPAAIVGPVGPSSVDRPAAVASGRLRVYSATETHADGDNTYYYPHTDYFVYDTTGKVLQSVHNHVGSMDEAPAWVLLPAGTYQVRARDQRLGLLTIPVVVRPGQTTVLHLDDCWTPAIRRDGPELVRLPDGEPIGWRASTDGTPGKRE